MRLCFSLLVVAAIALPATLGRAVEVDPASASPPARLTFADGWTLRLSEPAGSAQTLDGQRQDADPRGGPHGSRSDLANGG